MSSVGSFGTFTTARLAIYVSQKGLSVTGNNIANINTKGYTRQRLDQVSFKTGGSDRYQNSFDMRVGNGAIAKSVSQLRDPYLDIRYRAEHSSEGYYNGKLNGLEQIATILDEIGRGENSKGEEGDGLLYAQFSDFFKSLQYLQTSAGDEVNDTLVFNSADALCQLFQSNADRLERLKLNTETELRQDINDINSLLTSIRNLNESIEQAEIYGDGALELRDERNNLIDELSEKLKIDATYSMVNVGGQQVEKLTIRLGNANPDKTVQSDSSILVDGKYCAQLTTPKANDQYNDKYQVFDRESAAYEEAVKNLKKDPPVAVDDPDGGAAFKTLEDFEKAIDAALADPDKAMLPFRYLDPNGAGTNDPRKADQVFDDAYNITVTDLRDKNDKAWVDRPDVRDTLVTDPTGFPTKAKYTGEFKFSGVWKDGDSIDVGYGQKVVIGAPPASPDANTVYLSANDANGDAKNVSNAIRKAMMKSGQFDDYDITTKTTRTTDGFNVQLTVKAKEPGEQQGTLPTINISAKSDPNNPPSVGIGNAVQATDKDGKNIDGRFTAEITAAGDPNKFHSGDIITIATTPAVTLEVGKDISVNGANDPARLAAKLAQKMKVDGFTVSSTTDKDGKAYLVFQGAKDAAAPTVPTVSAKAADPVTFTGIAGGTITNGQPATPDVEDMMNAPPETVDNGDNTISKVTTRYYMDDNDKWHKVVRSVTSSKDKVLDDNDLFGELQAVREMLTEEGEFASQADINMDESASIKRGIPYYQHCLDLLARKFAETLNDANTGYAVDQKGNYLSTEKDADGAQIPLLGPDGKPISKTDGPTDAQKAAMEADALGNYIKANFAGFVKDADGKNTNVLADELGKPLTVGGTELTTENVQIDGKTTLKDVDFAGVNKDGKLVDTNGNVIGVDNTDPANPKDLPIGFTDTAFGEVKAAAGTDEAAKEQAEIDAKKAAATADLNKQALDSYLGANGGDKLGGNLFSVRGDTDDAEGITAANISVAQSWSKGLVHVVPTFTKLFGGETGNTTQNDNALHMGNLIDRALVYNPQDLLDDAVSNHLFEGSFQDMFVKMSNTQGNDQRSTEKSLLNHMGQALDIDTSRDSVSAVDLNDEAMDLMQYTHSLNAAYRLMTTIDDMIERLITGTGVTR